MSLMHYFRLFKFCMMLIQINSELFIRSIILWRTINNKKKTYMHLSHPLLISFISVLDLVSSCVFFSISSSHVLLPKKKTNHLDQPNNPKKNHHHHNNNYILHISMHTKFAQFLCHPPIFSLLFLLIHCRFVSFRVIVYINIKSLIKKSIYSVCIRMIISYANY